MGRACESTAEAQRRRGGLPNRQPFLIVADVAIAGAFAVLIIGLAGTAFVLLLFMRARKLAQRETVRMRGIVAREIGATPPRARRLLRSETALRFSFSVLFSAALFLALRGLWQPALIALSLAMVSGYWGAGSALFERKARRGDYAGALAVAERRLKLTPGDATYLHLRGRALLGLGRHEDAATSLYKALAQVDSWFEARAIVRDLGTALANLGQQEEAARCARAELELVAEIPF